MTGRPKHSLSAWLENQTPGKNLEAPDQTIRLTLFFHLTPKQLTSYALTYLGIAQL